MKALLVKYKSVIKFILTFLLVYLILSFSYKLYLDFSNGSKYYPDYITNLVARQTNMLLNGYNYDSKMLPHPDEPSMKVIVNGKYVARIIEGCNGISVLILFVSFIVAFADQVRNTFFYILAGCILIYAVNLLRIAVISIWLYHYPWRRDILHSIIFPLIIYGMVFILWMFWVNRFSKSKKISA